MDILMGHTGQGIWLILLLSLPAVLLAAGIGLIVGILQAVTQVQEQTIAAAPKILFVFLLVIFGGPFMIEVLKDFTVESVHLGMEVVPREELMILPPKPRMAYGEDNSTFNFFKEKKRVPKDSRVKTMMSNQTPMKGLFASEGGKVKVTAKPKPKSGVGEQIYMKRRAAGQLPAPPRE